MYFGKLYYAGIFPFLSNKKEIKFRSNILKIDSVVSTKLSPDSSFIELLGRDTCFNRVEHFEHTMLLRLNFLRAQALSLR